MSKNIFDTPEGDKLTDDFTASCDRLTDAQGEKLKTVLVAAQTREGTSVSLQGCTCHGCKMQILETVARALNFGEVRIVGVAIGETAELVH